MPPSISPRGGMKGGPSCRMCLLKTIFLGGSPFMPIIQRLFILPHPQQNVPPAKRQCFLCHRFGAHAHGFFPRSPSSGDCSDSEMIEIPRFLCLNCQKTFSLLPRFLLRRVRPPLPILVFLAQTTRTWWELYDRLEVAWNTLWSWKKIGRALLILLPQLLESVATWGELSIHLSRWQYPKSLRKINPTIP